MANHTVSGKALLPDASGPLMGSWTIALYSTTGLAFSSSADWRGGSETRQVAADGSLTWSLPDTTDDYQYVAVFATLDKRKSYGPYVFELTANITWQSIIGSPNRLPVPPGIIILNATDPVPPGTPPDTFILRRP